MSINSKHSAGKNEKSGKRAKRKKMEDSEDLDSSEEELDLTKECHPIGYYINDRAEMINQMFSVIKGNKLKAMLPPILKDCDIDTLKLQCLDQLLGMSDKRIACILDGEVLDTSSESDVESNDYSSDGKQKSSPCSASHRSDESMDVDLQNEEESKTRRKTKKKSHSGDAERSGKSDQNNTNAQPAEQGKTLLEILELEMRARAIRALLKQNEGSIDGNAEQKTSKENGVKDEVVDLTGCEDDDCAVTVKKDKEQDSIDEKVSTFEEKVEKSQAEKGSQEQEVKKTKRLQAELELRNKLFKKKTYRTRQQRMENEEEDEEEKPDKEKPEPAERVEKDVPEEGEISSSEETEKEKNANLSLPNEEPENPTNIIVDNSVTNDNAENENLTEPGDAVETIQDKSNIDEGMTDSQECPNFESEDDVLNIDNQEMDESEETSWRERWLRKGGVQKLVKSSKIYAKVKKRIAEKSLKSKDETECKSEDVDGSKVEVIEGSIQEYEKLVGKTLQTSEDMSADGVGEEFSEGVVDGNVESVTDTADGGTSSVS